MKDALVIPALFRGWVLEVFRLQVGSLPLLSFAGICFQDGPVGNRKTDYVSVFPAGINAGATWDRELAYARGQAMGLEMNDKGVDGQLAPVCGPLGRSPDGGRNWEGFSNDPYLCGAIIAPTIQGIQEHVMATSKHYILNEQEHFRQSPEAQGQVKPGTSNASMGFANPSHSGTATT